ncbi:MAG: hypothetical protein LBS69_04675 [Prevotellaceae bacterium]|jgi:hypothetical protein|nr:hypothetical protein [Prevotellaceae bacterium]
MIVIDNYKDFIKTYTQNLVADSKNSTEITEKYIKIWIEILSEHKL